MDKAVCHSTDPPRRKIVILGSTGSIGTNCLDVVAHLPERLQAVGLTAHSSVDALLRQAEQHRPRWIAVTDPAACRRIESAKLAAGCERLTGPDAVNRMVTQPEVDVVVSAIVGAAGLEGTWAALEAGKTVAVANKETLVMAGPLVTDLAARRGGRLLPVDSEHSAIFQALQGSKADAIERIVLTGSGGPFRGRTRAELAKVTPAEALRHPTWKMGPKITIDSATLMNKALEVIEARWLFNLPPERIEVIIHPESVIHSFVEFKDGSVLAQLSPPDMRLPIQYALTYPDRVAGPARRLNWRELSAWHFEQPDHETFPSLQLGYEVARRGGTCGAILNAANEAAVQRFLGGELDFLDIPRLSRGTGFTQLQSHADAGRAVRLRSLGTTGGMPLDQPPTPDRSELVKPTPSGPPPADAFTANAPAPTANGAAPPPAVDGEAPPASAVPLTPMAWLAQNGVYLVAFAAILGALYYYLDFEGIIKAAVVAVGLGLVIFVHELGHFLAAKWCDVHVQTFSLGFGPAIPGCSFRRGETLYKIAVLPLGGYVAMVGEGTDADEEENYPRSFKNKTVGQRMLIISAGVVMNMILGCICFVIVFYFHGVPRIRGVVNSVEPGSPAWTAGVPSGSKILRIGGKENPNFNDLRMKVLFSGKGDHIEAAFGPLNGEGAPLVVDLVARREKSDDAPVIGIGSGFQLQLRESRWGKNLDVPCIAGSSSAKARLVELKPGDVVLKATAGDKDTLSPRPSELSIRWEELAKFLGDHPASAVTLEIATKPVGDNPAKRTASVPADGFHFGDRIIGTTDPDQDRGGYDPLVVAPLPLDAENPVKDRCDVFAFHKRVRQLAGLPMVIQIHRAEQGASDPPVNLLLPAAFTPTTGLRMQMGRVAGVRNNSPAAKAALQEGDKVTRVEMYLDLPDAAAGAVGRPLLKADLQDFDPCRLPSDLAQAAKRMPGKKLVRITVLRENQSTGGSGDSHIAASPLVLDPVPWDESWDFDIEIPTKPSCPMAIPQLGVVYWVQCTVNQVTPGSPADVAGIRPGDRVAAIQVEQPRKKTEPNKKVWDDFADLEPSRDDGRDPDQWAFYGVNLQLLSSMDCPAIRVKVVRGNSTVQEDGKDKEFEITPTYDNSWPSENLGLLFMPDMELEKASSVWQAVALGFNESTMTTLQIYLGMRSVVTGRIKLSKGLGGPVMIATQAFGAAEDPYEFLMFMAMISVNLAVLNFLPIPVLDGGHMVLLVYEKVRGKPPSDTWKNVLTIIGLALLLLLMLGATFLDLGRIFKFLKFFRF